LKTGGKTSVNIETTTKTAKSAVVKVDANEFARCVSECICCLSWIVSGRVS
jgi:hypothetical protein